MSKEKISPAPNKSLSFDEAFVAMDKATDAQFKDLRNDVFKFTSPGETVSFMVQGIEETKIKGEWAKVVNLVDRTGKKMINWDSVFVGACENLPVLPAYVRATYVGDVTGENGTYKNIEVKYFPVS